MNKGNQKADPLGGAINQLESLLQQQSARGELAPDRELPVLDEFVDADAPGDEATPESRDIDRDVELTRAELEQAMSRLTEQLELELETLKGLLKESMLHEFRKEMASVLGVDETSSDNRDSGRGAEEQDGNPQDDNP